MSESRIDVIIPAYDAGAYLGEAIASVRAQSHPAARIVVVDDASRDATATVARAAGARETGADTTRARRAPRTAILRSEEGVPIELIRFDTNRGAAAARNAGLLATSSSLVAFLDADDRWTADKLALQSAALDADAELSFVLCRVRQFVGAEADAGERRRLMCDLTPYDGWCASALLARRRAFDQIGTFAEELRIGEVIDWFSRARHLRHAVLDTVAVERRLHAGNSTRRTAITGRDYLEVLRRHRARRRAQDTR